jgi:glycosyltransferase involved in cell wall biosynthesis
VSVPLVSVLIPTYNHVHYIGEAIVTAVEQDYPDLQVVVTDDGSTDGTRDVVAGFAAKYPDRITALLGEHVGLAGNCNRGLVACRGTYIACTSGDDVFLPGKVSRQVAWLDADERHVLCGHDVDVFESDSGRVLYRWSEYFPLPSGSGPERLVRVGHLYPGPSIMARASVMQRHRYDARFGLMCDWKFWIDVLVSSNGHFEAVDGVFARYRRHAGSVTIDEATLPARLADVLMTVGAVESEWPSLVRACRLYRAKVLLKLAAGRLTAGERRAARQYLWAALRSDPFVSWKVPAALLLSAAPDSFREAMLKRYVSPTKI